MSFMSDFLGLRDTETLKRTILNSIRELGGNFASADYSGGNDEGGVDDVRVFLKPEGDEKHVEIPLGPAFGDRHPLWDAFDELLSHEFGTWAGEFSAEGTVYADVNEQRIWRTGSMSTYTEDESAGEY